ncbi:type II secretion system protein GspM [Elongatibacter sediminis]|uniref:Type II secretion system protein GspM n=1 Tax=Elongatibacter sediminis TaxID=3119006 RepID=A0AAW9RAJ4_9GAMM
MALSLSQGNSRTTAVLLAVIVVILIYLVGFHWFILRHIAYSDEIGALSGQLERYQRVAAQRDEVEAQLESLQSRRSESNLFLPEADFNEAAAGMSERLNQMISTQAEESCQVVSRQPVRARVVERFEKVTVNVRMRCAIDDLMRVLYSLETGVPMIIAEEVTVIKPRARRRRNSQAPADVSALDVRFNMAGYLRSP